MHACVCVCECFAGKTNHMYPLPLTEIDRPLLSARTTALTGTQSTLVSPSPRKASHFPEPPLPWNTTIPLHSSPPLYCPAVHDSYCLCLKVRGFASRGDARTRIVRRGAPEDRVLFLFQNKRTCIFEKKKKNAGCGFLPVGSVNITPCASLWFFP